MLASSVADLRALDADPGPVEKEPDPRSLLKSIQTAEPRPKAVKYRDATLGSKTPRMAQSKFKLSPRRPCKHLVQLRLSSIIVSTRPWRSEALRGSSGAFWKVEQHHDSHRPTIQSAAPLGRWP